MDFDGQASNGEKTRERNGRMRGERGLAESEKEELEICKPRYEESGEAAKVKGGQIQRQNNEETDYWEYSYKPCKTLWDDLSDDKTVTQRYKDRRPYLAQIPKLILCQLQHPLCRLLVFLQAVDFREYQS